MLRFGGIGVSQRGAGCDPSFLLEGGGPRPPARRRHGRIVLFRGCGNFPRNIIKLLIFSHFLYQFEVKNSDITAGKTAT
jgi:hypothetical protein